MNMLLAISFIIFFFSSYIPHLLLFLLSFCFGVSCCGFMGLRLEILERVSITGKTDRDIGFRKTGLL